MWRSGGLAGEQWKEARPSTVDPVGAAPAISRAVTLASIELTGASITLPEGTAPFKEMMKGTRMPPS